MNTNTSSPYIPKKKAIPNIQNQSGLLKDQLQLVKTTNDKGLVKYELKPIQSQLSFDKGFYVFMRAVQLLTSHSEGTIVVGVAGPSGSGKTAFCDKVVSFMPEIAILHMDMYNCADRLIDGNFDDPRLSDMDLLLANIQGLKEGRQVETPIYDFKTSTRVGYRTVEVPRSRVVIVEGIYALSEKLRPLLDLRVSITGGVHFDLVKRVLRDVNRSGQAPEEIIQQISETVYPMYKAYIEPDLATAHLKIYNNFNPFTGFMEPTFILKSDHPVSEDRIRDVFDEMHAEDLAAAAREITTASHQIARSASGKALSPHVASIISPEGPLSQARVSGNSPLAGASATDLPAPQPFLLDPASASKGSQKDGPEATSAAPTTPSAFESVKRRSSQTGPSPLTAVSRDAVETYDIYLLPPHEDPETCSSWLRMRNRDGRYQLMFEESMVDGPFIISPRISFEVSVKLLGGLMALGYQIGAIMRRSSILQTDGRVTVKLDTISMMPEKKFVQVQGRDRDRVMETAKRLGLAGTFIAKTYIEQVQLDKLTSAFSSDALLMEDLKSKLVADGTPIFEEAILGTTPDLTGSFLKGHGFKSVTGFPSPLKSPRASEGGGGAGSSNDRRANGLLASSASSADPRAVAIPHPGERPGSKPSTTAREGGSKLADATASSTAARGNGDVATGTSPAASGRRTLFSNVSEGMPVPSPKDPERRSSRGPPSGGLASELGASLRGANGAAALQASRAGTSQTSSMGPGSSPGLTVAHLKDVEARLAAIGDRMEASQATRDVTSTLLQSMSVQQEKLRVLVEGVLGELRESRQRSHEAEATRAEEFHARLDDLTREIRALAISQQQHGPVHTDREQPECWWSAWWMPSPLTVVVGSALVTAWLFRGRPGA